MQMSIKKNKCRVGFPDYCLTPPLMDPERLRKTRTNLPSSRNVNGGFCIQEQKVGSKLRIIRAQAVTTGDAMVPRVWPLQAFTDQTYACYQILSMAGGSF